MPEHCAHAASCQCQSIICFARPAGLGSGIIFFRQAGWAGLWHYFFFGWLRLRQGQLGSGIIFRSTTFPFILVISPFGRAPHGPSTAHLLVAGPGHYFFFVGPAGLGPGIIFFSWGRLGWARALFFFGGPAGLGPGIIFFRRAGWAGPGHYFFSGPSNENNALAK